MKSLAYDTHRGRSTAGTRSFTGRNNHFPQSNSHKQNGSVNPRHLWYFSKLPSPALPIFITSGGSTAVVRPGRHWRTNGRRRTRQPQRPNLPSPCAVPRTLPCMENTDDTLSPSLGYKTATGKVQGSGLSRPTHSSFELTPAAAERKDGRRGKERHQHDPWPQHAERERAWLTSSRNVYVNCKLTFLHQN